ncbi:MAG: ABC transporter ATP-binding protein [Lachnospiraceae bacterium]|nr:ABC transporter ATP-binding protein [Lachnospiraceae bacterium]
MKEHLLQVKNLNIIFGNQQHPQQVVYDLCLTMDPSEILGIVGESGSGKTQTALAIAGLLNRHLMDKSGEIMFQGTDLLSCSREKLRSFQGSDIGNIFQEPMTSLNPVKKIGWQVEESLRIHTKLTAKERKEKALSMLRMVELKEPERVYEQYPHELSGGMRQRVMIAAAMINEPKLLIADEPTTALDVTIQKQIIKLLLKINRENHTAILFISHDLSLVSRICSRVIVMQNGRIVEEGTADSIFEHPGEDYTRQLVAAIPQIIPRTGGTQNE